MAKKRSPVDDQKFDEFLQKHFAELKRELAKYPAPGAALQGKILQLSQTPQARAGRGSWSALSHPWQRRLRHIHVPLKYGIAAAVLVAVAVPMVIQLNQQKTELVSKAEAPAERPTVDHDEAGEKADGYLKNAPAKTKKKGKAERVEDIIEKERSAPTLKASREEAAPKDAMAAGKAERKIPEEEVATTNAVRDNDPDKFFAKKEEAKPSLAQDNRSYRADDVAAGAPAAPAAAPAPRPTAPSRSAAPATEISGGDRGAAMAGQQAPAETNARSIAIDDAKTRFKKQDASDEEKAEMEKLWKEFEKDPKSFNQDKKRSSRLRTLLSRHNEKSRAKRMKAVQ